MQPSPLLPVPPPEPAAAVLLAGFAAADLRRLAAELDPALAVLSAASAEAALDLLAVRPAAVLALGPGVAGAAARAFLAEMERRFPSLAPSVLVLAAGDDLAAFADLVQRDRVFYLCREPLPAPALGALLASAWQHRRAAAAAAAPEVTEEDELPRWLAALDARLPAAADLDEALAALAEVASEAVQAAAVAWIYDPAQHALRRAGARRGQPESAAVGLLGFTARTGLPLRLAGITADPRYDAEADNPDGLADPHLLTAAVPGIEGGLQPLLAVLRPAGRPAFGVAEERLVEGLAAAAAPVLRRLAAAAAALPPGSQAELFREEAVAEYTRGFGERGSPLELAPGWTRWTWPLLMAGLAALVLFAALARVHEVADGPAVVRIGGRTDVTAVAAGVVGAVAVRPGQAVGRGDLLVRLHGAPEEAELARLAEELDGRLRQRLLDPGDAAVAAALLGARTALERARASLDQLAVRAPRAGTVSGLRIRPGQRLNPGQVLATLAEPTAGGGGAAGGRIVALLPGRYRPLLRAGLPVRLELEGYPYHYERLRVAAAGEEVIGPAEARLALGETIADSVEFAGPVVLVEAELPAGTFAAGGREVRFHDGMRGRAEVRVRSESVLLTLVPGLRALLGEPAPPAGAVLEPGGAGG